MSKYKPEEELVDFLDQVLTYNAKGRLKPYEGLIHPYFKDLPKHKEVTDKIPHLFNFKDLISKTNQKDI